MDGRELARDFLLGRQVGSVICLDNAPDLVEPLPCAVAIGAFDGFHRGHQELIRLTSAYAASHGLRAAAVTFDPDPDAVVAPHPALSLMSIDDRVRSLALAGMDVLVVPFTPAVAAMGHEEFFDRVLAPFLDIRAVHVGSDFRLGARGASTVEVICAWGAGRGIEVFGHDLVLEDGRAISATRIRERMSQGGVEEACRELGHRPMVRGRVEHGRGEGTDMGFPTANIAVDASMQLPADGVYAGFACYGSRVWPAAINVGIPPMFSDSSASAHLEANLLGYSGDLYGCDVAVSFDTRLRASQTFDSVDELIDVVHRDIDHVAAMFGSVELEAKP